MVKIINYKERTTKDGDSFFVFTVQGGIEMVKSQSTGDFYATARKASIPTTFDEETCKALIGTDMAGSIVKSECEPYEYTIKDTGEIIVLSHQYVYVPPSEHGNPKNQPYMKAEAITFSANGKAKTFA